MLTALRDPDPEPPHGDIADDAASIVDSVPWVQAWATVPEWENGVAYCEYHIEVGRVRIERNTEETLAELRHRLEQLTDCITPRREPKWTHSLTPPYAEPRSRSPLSLCSGLRAWLGRRVRTTSRGLFGN